MSWMVRRARFLQDISIRDMLMVGHMRVGKPSLMLKSNADGIQDMVPFPLSETSLPKSTPASRQSLPLLALPLHTHRRCIQGRHWHQPQHVLQRILPPPRPQKIVSSTSEQASSCLRVTPRFQACLPTMKRMSSLSWPTAQAATLSHMDGPLFLLDMTKL